MKNQSCFGIATYAIIFVTIVLFDGIVSQISPECIFNPQFQCDPNNQYRTYDGSCNNLKTSWWGSAEAPYKRWLPANYADNKNEPRVATDGLELPNPRKISCMLNKEENETESSLTHMFMQWGQYVSIGITGLKKSSEKCTDCKKTDKCIPIVMDDNCAPTMNAKCFEFSRSINLFEGKNCQREQINTQNSFIDGSGIYGATAKIADSLRDKSQKGFLLTSVGVHHGLNLLPIDTSPNTTCSLTVVTDKCFTSGDSRINMVPGFQSVQTILIREHNRIAKILSDLNPHWGDEQVFQETRRIIVAITQHVTYNEFLPVLLSKFTMDTYGLNVAPENSYFEKYDPNIDPRVANEYASAAGRYGHSTIRTTLSRYDKSFEPSTSDIYELHKHMFKIDLVLDESKGGMESVLRGYLKDPLMKIDRYYSSSITQHLFEKPDANGNPTHQDLISINIQRAREHGIPSYTKYREFCNLKKVNSFQELRFYFPDEVVDILQTLYKSVDDIDLFTALTSENKLEGSLVGPTLNCLIGLQFKELKFGDRFWYEINLPPAAFTIEQLNEIRKTTLAKVLCRNMFDTPLIQPNVFLAASEINHNSFVECSTLEDINFKHWISKKFETPFNSNVNQETFTSIDSNNGKFDTSKIRIGY